MNRYELTKLRSIRSNPCLTVLMPTHRTSPDNRQDPIRLKNLINEARSRLLAEYSKREIQPLLTRIEELASSWDFQYGGDGLALMASSEFSRAYPLPFKIDERVVIDETFATRDLMHAVLHNPHYWLLRLSENETRLYEGLNDLLIQVTEKPFPMDHTGPGGSTKLPGGKGISTSAVRDEHESRFFREVDRAFQTYANTDPRPLILAGAQREVSFFRGITQNGALLVADLEGNYDKTPLKELGGRAFPLIQSWLNAGKTAALDQLGKAIGTDKVASGAPACWKAAREGRGDSLIVEERYRYPAVITAAGDLAPAEDPRASQVVDDAVDDIIEAVLDRKGKVTFVDDGALADHDYIALVLRY